MLIELAAALLLVALFGTLLVQHGSPGNPRAATPTPILDPASQAYLSMLRTYYAAFAQAENAEIAQCFYQYNAAPLAQKPALLQACRPVEEAALRAA